MKYGSRVLFFGMLFDGREEGLGGWVCLRELADFVGGLFLK
jgi:hypothetical protein